MKWETFDESKRELPEVIVEKAIEGFSNATNSLADLIVSVKSEMARISSDKLKTKFQYVVQLVSKYLPDYSFRLLEFGYNVQLFPVKALISVGILEELNNRGEGFPQISSFENEEQFTKALELIFNSETFKEIVGGLMKIARKNSLSPF